MVYIVINLIPILLATLAGFLISGLFYPPGRAGGVTMAGLVPLLLTAFVAEFWLCAILAGALILAPAKADGWTMALGSAVVIWIGFVVPALVVTHRVRAQPWRVVAFDCAHWLVVMMVQVVLLKSIGLVPPPV